MSDNNSQNGIGLSEEYAEIFASVYGQTHSESEVPVSTVERSEAFADPDNIDWEGLYGASGAAAPRSGDTYEAPSQEHYGRDARFEREDRYAADGYSRDEYPEDEGSGDDYDEGEDYPVRSREYGRGYENGSKFDYDDDDGFYDDYDDDDDDGEVGRSSFREYLGARLTGTLFRLRGSVPASSSSSTMYDEEDELGREVTPRYAMKYYSSFSGSLRRRLRLAYILLFFIIWLSLGLPVPGSLKSLLGRVTCLTALQFLLMLVSLDVVTNAVINTFTGKFGADSLVVLSCLATTADALCIRFAPSFTRAHMPLCALSSFSLVGLLTASYLSVRGIRKALRVPAIGQKIYTVTGEEKIVGKDITLLKSTRPIVGYVRRMEECPLDEEAFRKVSPFLLIICLALSAAMIAIKKCYGESVYVFTAIFAPAVPFTALMCFAFPFFTGSVRIFSQGAAVAGWSGAYDVGHSKNLIVTDRDLFPKSSVEIENVRIFANYASDKVLSYACSLVRESESSLVGAFERLLEENNIGYSEVDSFEILQGGGFKGLIEGHVVTCGSTDLMRLLDVRLPFRLVGQRTVLLAIDGVLYGIFNMKYTPDPEVRKALVNLMRSNRHPVFATRDFNITPDMIRETYDVATDGYDFPPYQERFPISKARPAKDSGIAAVVCREGLASLTAMADTGRSIFVITKINVTLTLIFAFLAPVLVFLILYYKNMLNLGPELIYMAATALPVIILSILTKAPN